MKILQPYATSPIPPVPPKNWRVTGLSPTVDGDYLYVSGTGLAAVWEKTHMGNVTRLSYFVLGTVIPRGFWVLTNGAGSMLFQTHVFPTVPYGIFGQSLADCWYDANGRYKGYKVTEIP